MTNQNKESHIKWLNDFLVDWDYATDTDVEESESDIRVAKLCDDFEAYTKENNLPFISADELLCELTSD